MPSYVFSLYLAAVFNVFDEFSVTAPLKQLTDDVDNVNNISCYLHL